MKELMLSHLIFTGDCQKWFWVRYIYFQRENWISQAVKNKIVSYKPVSSRSRTSLQEYIFGFSALNRRINQGDDFFKYERTALLIVDFSVSPIKIYENVTDLKSDGFLPDNSKCSLKNLTFPNFIDDLLKTYDRRFGTGILS
ncbi:MAG: hypothetical protein L3J11_01580 [Draconibacterium sp.]|nr:hypothetical protein [Draconibacterium sp.]